MGKGVCAFFPSLLSESRKRVAAFVPLHFTGGDSRGRRLMKREEGPGPCPVLKKFFVFFQRIFMKKQMQCVKACPVFCMGRRGPSLPAVVRHEVAAHGFGRIDELGEAVKRKFFFKLVLSRRERTS